MISIRFGFRYAELLNPSLNPRFSRTGNLLIACVMLIVLGNVISATADTEANKALVNRLFAEVLNQGNLEVIDELVAPEFVHHTAGAVDAKGPEGYKELIGMFRVAFPDLNVVIEDMIAEDDVITTRQTYTGTHKGNLMDIPPTNVEVVFTGICTFRIVDGKIAKVWTEYDVLGVMLQLGVAETSPDWPPLNRQAKEDFIWTPPSDVTGDTGAPAANIAVIHRINDEVVNMGRAEVLDETVATTFMNHDPVWPVIVTSEDYKPWQIGFSQWPDGHQTIDLIFAEGDKVVSCWTYTWMEAAVGTVACPGIDIWRFADGKIVERWSSKDFFGMMQRMTPQTPETGPNKALVNRLFDEVFNQGNMDVIDEIVAPKFLHYMSVEVDIDSSEGYKELIGMFRTAFPDFNVTVEDMVAEGDMVTTRLTYTGTHKGNLRDISPTGAEVTFTGICTFKISDGKIVEGRTEYDVLGLMLQLGVMKPSPDWPPQNRTGDDFLWSAPSDVTGDSGDPETNKATVLRMYEVVNLGNVDVIDEVVGTNIANHDPIWSVINEFDVYKEWMGGFASDPTSHETVDLILAEGDKVVTHWTYSWLDASLGKRIKVSGADIWRLADGKIVERWSSKDFFGMLQRMTPEEPTEDYSNVFFLSLQSGLNMISLPLKPQIAYTARSLAEEVSATVVIKLDEAHQRFVGFTLDAPDDGFDIEGGKGYIVNVPESKAVALTGATWTNQPPVKEAPSLSIGSFDGAWAFVVSGKSEDVSVKGGYRVTVKNTRTNAIATDVTRKGYFAATFTDLTRKSVVQIGDRLEVQVQNQTGEIVSDTLSYIVTEKNIIQAFLPITLKDVFKPHHNLLLQNYPNPFNPETWIPYQLSEPSEVVIRIYNSQGQLVRTFSLGQREAGYYLSQARATYWNGRNSKGEKVASGVYFYQIKAGDFSAMRRMVIMK